MKHKILLLPAFFLVITNLIAQTYPASEISADLQKNAYAVVRESSEEFVQQDMNNGSYKVSYVVTILNLNGNSFADFHVYEDHFRELKNFSGEVFDASGKSVKKIAKKDLTTTALSSDLATDNKQTFYDLYYPTYPFTVRYNYEVKYKNGILMYPTFAPAAGNLAVEKADYTLQIPQDYILREKKLNTDVESERTAVKQNTQYKWSIHNWNAVEIERFAPFDELFPVVYLSPEKFCIDNVCGSMENWETFGQWQMELLKGRDVLPQKTIDKVLELTKDIPQTKDKVKALYEYLQATTHYVSIQLGIGGWQPIEAGDVVRTGFGDCKALSNYMRALLKAVNISSYYLVISTQKERFFPDYPNFTQANHAILMVPLANDTVWLECTSQTLPFGYIHSSIVGHDALAVGENDAFFYTLPQYPPLDNQEINAVDIYVSSEGHAEFNVYSTYKMDIFERMYSKLKGLSVKEENDVLGRLLVVQKPQVSNFRKEESLTDRPELNIQYTIKCDEYASKTGSRMFIPVDPARTSLKNLFTGNIRKQPIVMKSSISQVDTIRIHIPDNYVVETKPKSVEINSDYGSFRSEIKEDAGVLIYSQILELVPRRYQASEFEEIKAFYNKVENLQTSKIGLKKNE